MKKILGLTICLFMFIGFVLAGCAPAEESANQPSEPTQAADASEAAEETPAATASGAGPLLAFICKDLSQEWFVGTSTTMKEVAVGLGARDVLLFDCEMSPDKYMAALDSAISQEVDVLIVCPPDQQLSEITVQRCNEAGIKVMADDDGLIDTNGVHIAPALELNAYVVGSTQGEWLAKYYNDNNLAADIEKTAYMVLTMNEVSSCVPRAEGAVDAFKKGVPDFPEEKIIKANYDGTSDEAFDVVVATIAANPDIEKWVVTGANEEGAQGAARALEQSGLDKNACVVGMGAYLAVDEFKKDYSCFKAATYYDPVEDGTIAATAAMKWYTDGVVPYSEYKKDGEEFGVYPFGAVMVDTTNYEEIMGVAAK